MLQNMLPASKAAPQAVTVPQRDAKIGHHTGGIAEERIHIAEERYNGEAYSFITQNDRVRETTAQGLMAASTSGCMHRVSVAGDSELHGHTIFCTVFVCVPNPPWGECCFRGY